MFDRAWRPSADSDRPGRVGSGVERQADAGRPLGGVGPLRGAGPLGHTDDLHGADGVGEAVERGEQGAADVVVGQGHVDELTVDRGQEVDQQLGPPLFEGGRPAPVGAGGADPAEVDRDRQVAAVGHVGRDHRQSVGLARAAAAEDGLVVGGRHQVSELPDVDERPTKQVAVDGLSPPGTGHQGLVEPRSGGSSRLLPALRRDPLLGAAAVPPLRFPRTEPHGDAGCRDAHLPGHVRAAEDDAQRFPPVVGLRAIQPAHDHGRRDAHRLGEVGRAQQALVGHQPPPFVVTNAIIAERTQISRGSCRNDSSAASSW